MKTFFNQNLRYFINNDYFSIETIASATGISVEELRVYYYDYCEPGLETIIPVAHLFKISIESLLLEDLEQNETKVPNFDCKFLVLDIDGVMTDGGIIYTENGDEIKKFNAKDGLAIIRKVKEGLPVGFLSSGFTNKIIEHRAKVLGVQYVYIGTWKKLEILTKWCKELGIGLENVAYIGDDLNDLEVIEKVGFSACPADASMPVKNKVNLVLSAKGGKACVREFVDNYL